MTVNEVDSFEIYLTLRFNLIGLLIFMRYCRFYNFGNKTFETHKAFRTRNYITFNKTIRHLVSIKNTKKTYKLILRFYMPSKYSISLTILTPFTIIECIFFFK